MAGFRDHRGGLGESSTGFRRPHEGIAEDRLEHPDSDPADFYARRDELLAGQVFRTCAGDVVRLARRLPGDGTDWIVFDWQDGWSDDGNRVHPADLGERLPDDFEGDPPGPAP